MYRLIFIAKNNLKKKKSDVAVLFFLIMLAALLLYVSISVLTHTKDIIQNVYDKTNSADFFLSSGCEKVEEITSVLEEQPEVVELEKGKGIYLLSLDYYKGAERNEEKGNSFLIQPIKKEQKMNTIPEIENLQADSILLPYHMKASSGYRIGDTIHLSIGETEKDYTVSGFVEDIFFSTLLNIDCIQCYITDEEYQKLVEEESVASSGQVTVYRVILQEGTDTMDFEEKVSVILNKEIPEYAFYMNMMMDMDSMKVGNAMMSNIIMGIILAFSLVLIAVALIIVRFSVKNFIKGNLKNIGILMAIGYTAKQLIFVSMVEMLSIAFFGSIIAILLGNILSKPVGNMEASFIGLSWNPAFDAKAAFIVGIIVCIVIWAVTYFASHIYRKISVLEAMRGGLATHNFHKSSLPLEKCPLPQGLTLGCKSILEEKAKYIAIFCITILLSIASSTGFALYQNFGKNTDVLFKMISLELGDAIISGDNIEEKREEIEDLEMISKVNSYNNDKITIYTEEEKTTVACEFWDTPEKIDNMSMIEGKLPEYDNEIVVSMTLKRELGIELGDVVYVEGQQEKEDFVVCGFNQRMAGLGRGTLMTMEAGRRLNGESPTMKIYAYLKDGYSFGDLEEKILQKFPNVTILDSKATAANITSTLSGGMFLICLVFVGITVFIVFLVVNLLVKTKMISEWRQYGIYKALGFTTKQLIVQTMMSNLPVITAGAITGGILSIYILNPFVGFCLSTCGIFECDLSIQPIWFLTSVIIIVTVAAIVSFSCSFKVRKLKPIEMLNEE